jgi:hypothetical protein
MRRRHVYVALRELADSRPSLEQTIIYISARTVFGLDLYESRWLGCADWAASV